MINRDSLSHEINIFSIAISISENQFDAFWEELKLIIDEYPSLIYEIDGAWSYHNGGYYYKEIRIDHPIPGRAEEIMERLVNAIRFIPVRRNKNATIE